MTDYIMLDDTNLEILAKKAAGAQAIAGYVNGTWANWDQVVAEYEKSGKHLVSIDVIGDADAQCLDVERGDATPAQAPAWVQRTMEAGIKARDLRWFPKIYVEEGSARALIDAIEAAHIGRSDIRIWTGHWTGIPHICTMAYGCSVDADATQWSNRYASLSLDINLCKPSFFDGPPAADKPPVAVKPPEYKLQNGIVVDSTLITRRVTSKDLGKTWEAEA